MRGCALTWPFTFGVRLGWASCWYPNPRPAEARGRVYLLRGNAVVFSRGLGLLCNRFRAAGFWAEDLRCVGDRWVRKHLRAVHASGKLSGPVIFVGHSCGGRYALYTAQQMARVGIPIDLLVCIDVAMPYEVASNVRHAAHIYRSRMRLYPARPLRPSAGSSAAIENLDLDAEGSPLSPRWLHHLNMTDSQAVQDWIVARVLRTVGAEEHRAGGNVGA